MATAPTWYERNATMMKVLLCGFLLLILLIPASMIRGLITERASRAQEAKNEIYAKWGGTQVLTGPIISVPYTAIEIDSTIGERKVTRYIHILPDTLDISTTLSPEIRKRGIFETVVYTSKNVIKGDFKYLASLVPADKKVDWAKAVISFGISDTRGISGDIVGTLDEKPLTWQPGLVTHDVLSTGIHTARSIDPASDHTFTLSIELRGGEMVSFLPLGKTTTVRAQSPWVSPSFDGAFLPLEKTLTKDGFTARWQVTEFNRNFPQSWDNTDYQLSYVPVTAVYKYDEAGYARESMAMPSSGANIGDNAFGVRLIQTVDHYDKSERAAKYAVLLIALSFLVFFLLEIVHKKPIHAIQYLLIGFALVVFYTLLLAFSEHVGFNWSYVIASLATVGLIALYTKSIWDSNRFALYMGGILAFLYGLIFVILQSEDYALMIGSVTIFLILALVMYVTRRIDWYKPR
jgi:inner membrane protein